MMKDVNVTCINEELDINNIPSKNIDVSKNIPQ